jgi:hypothetical protein
METNQLQPQKKSRAEQARINGAKSQGPVTTAGKARSRQARIKHGRYARSDAKGASFLLRNENPEEYALFRQGWLARFQPKSIAEQEYADTFIANEWRLIRSQAAETALLNNQIRSSKAVIDAEIQHLPPAAREEARLGHAVTALYEKSGAAEALDRKISQLHRARLSTLQAWAILQDRFPIPEGRTQEVVHSKPFLCSDHSKSAPAGTRKIPA